jgi:hypothetical protein
VLEPTECDAFFDKDFRVLAGFCGRIQAINQYFEINCAVFKEIQKYRETTALFLHSQHLYKKNFRQLNHGAHPL